MILLSYVILGVYLVIASYCDLKYLEIPDWLSYSLIFLGISLAFGFSILNNNWLYLIESLAGLGVAYILAALFYYTGLWGGGDAKVLMGIGSFMGVSIKKSPLFINLIGNSLLGFNLFFFIFFLLLGGTLFGLFFIFYQAIKNPKKFREIYLKKRKETQHLFLFLLALVLGSFMLALLLKTFHIRILILLSGLMSFVGYFLFLLIIAVEESIMTIEQSIEKLTPGDWLVEDIIVEGKKVCKKKKTGLDEEDIEKLKKLAKENKIKKVKIRNGYPFIPAFLVALILYFFFSDLLVRLFIAFMSG